MANSFMVEPGPELIAWMLLLVGGPIVGLVTAIFLAVRERRRGARRTVGRHPERPER
jgi:hypothetical protein